MWIADNAYKDVTLGRIYVEGIFDQITLPRSDIRYNKASRLFFGVTEVHADTTLVLNLVDLKTGDILSAAPLRVKSDNPLRSHDFTWRIRSMPIPHEGSYEWALIHEGEKLASVRFEAHYAEEEGDQEKDENNEHE
jgi:hypothetical protein